MLVLSRCPDLEDAWCSMSRFAFPTRALALNLQLKSDLSELEDLEGIDFEFGSGAAGRKSAAGVVKRLIAACRASDVGLVANQKVVAEEFVDAFRREGILCLERLGTRGIADFCTETETTIVGSAGKKIFKDAKSA